MTIGGGSRPAVRVELNPSVLAHYGLGLEDVRGVLNQVNSNVPRGVLENDRMRWVLSDNAQIFTAKDYRPLVVAYRNGAPVRLGDIADVEDSIENLYVAGLSNTKQCVIIYINRQPGANIVATVDKLLALLPLLRSEIPPSMKLLIEHDRTQTIRASVDQIQGTLLITVVLVILVIFVFLRSLWSTIIPAIAVPVSLVGTFGVLYISGYSLDNLSLMALTVATGFVVDDAIVVIENITRYLEAGLTPLEAALRGTQEIGFTVLSMSTSLVAIFIPILLMGGIVGRLFREFAVTLSVAIAISLLVSLTTTPMMCAKFLRPVRKDGHNWIYRVNERCWQDFAEVVRRRRAIGVAAPGSYTGRYDRYGRPERDPLLLQPEGILSTAGHAGHSRLRSSGARCVSFESMQTKEMEYSQTCSPIRPSLM